MNVVVMGLMGVIGENCCQVCFLLLSHLCFGYFLSNKLFQGYVSNCWP